MHHRPDIHPRPRPLLLSPALVRLVLALLLPMAGAATACSSGAKSTASPPCNENPWTCPAGQTCWPMVSGDFACLNSGPGQVGSTCEDTVGTPTCGDGLACLSSGAAVGVCTPYCSTTDPSHACTGGAVCEMAQLLVSGAEFQICAASTLADAATFPVSDATLMQPADGGPSAECAAWAAQESSKCPGMDESSTLATCAQSETLYFPEGCGAAWEAYASCAAQADYSCAIGPSGCDAQQNGYFDCQSAFVAETGCDRTPDQDLKCPATAPYGFTCLAGVPGECTQLPPNGGATIACCPQFPPP